jgi:hypothetical protein
MTVWNTTDIVQRVCDNRVAVSPCVIRIKFDAEDWRTLEVIGMTNQVCRDAVNTFRTRVRRSLQVRVHQLIYAMVRRPPMSLLQRTLISGGDRQARVIFAREMFAKLVAFTNDSDALIACLFGRCTGPRNC